MGCNLENNEKEPAEKDAKVEEAELAAQKYLENNYKNIDSISFTDHETNPMGALMIRGYLNGDESKKFSVQYDFNQKDIVVGIVDAEAK
ncbi:DUF1433 domain-containing protein [Metabacillus indicus]|uniref:DUF1433 domain-containing protein n=1 Tax=Metabacillus indicus TaxID=246786 RepID=UPI003CEE6FE6